MRRARSIERLNRSRCSASAFVPFRSPVAITVAWSHPSTASAPGAHVLGSGRHQHDAAATARHGPRTDRRREFQSARCRFLRGPPHRTDGILTTIEWLRDSCQEPRGIGGSGARPAGWPVALANLATQSMSYLSPLAKPGGPPCCGTADTSTQETADRPVPRPVRGCRRIERPHERFTPRQQPGGRGGCSVTRRPRRCARSCRGRGSGREQIMVALSTPPETLTIRRKIFSPWTDNCPSSGAFSARFSAD